MKHLLSILVITLLTISFAAAREWTAVSGHKITGDFVKCENGTIEIQLADGKTAEVKLEQLSDADKEFVRQETEKAKQAEVPNPFVVKDTAATPAYENATVPPTERKAGDLLELTIKDVKCRFRWCPPGTFKMGSPANEIPRMDNETQHEVQLTKGFWIQATETPQKLWQAVTGKNPSQFKGDDLPVETISWNDTQKFIAELNRLNAVPAGYRFSLPTEAQWEYAARAGTETTFHFGNVDARPSRSDVVIGQYAWFGKNAEEKTHPVAQKKPNQWNLYDTIGNVGEYCQDIWRTYTAEKGTDPVGKEGPEYMVRGGNWGNMSVFVRTAYRFGGESDQTSPKIGLRLALLEDANAVPIPIQKERKTDVAVAVNVDTKTTKTTTLSVENHKAGELLELTIKGVKYRFRWCPPGDAVLGMSEEDIAKKRQENQAAFNKSLKLIEQQKAANAGMKSQLPGYDGDKYRKQLEESEAVIRKKAAKEITIVPQRKVSILPIYTDAEIETLKANIAKKRQKDTDWLAGHIKHGVEGASDGRQYLDMYEDFLIGYEKYTKQELAYLDSLRGNKVHRGFWMLETEVTVEMWESILEGARGGRYRLKHLEKGKGGKSASPVSHISPTSYQEFIAAINEIGAAPSGYQFMLPTESQWEYACRAGSDTEPTDIGGYLKDVDDMWMPITTQKPNRWNLYGMYGIWLEYTSTDDGTSWVLRGRDSPSYRFTSEDAEDIGSPFVLIGRVTDHTFRIALLPLGKIQPVTTEQKKTDVAVAVVVKTEEKTAMPPREWTRFGSQFTGNFVKCENGIVEIKLEDGNVIKVELWQLSITDKEYIQQNSPKPAAQPPVREAVKVENRTPIDTLKQLAEEDNPEALYELADRYYDGRNGCEKNQTEQERHLVRCSKLAGSGNSAAQLARALCLLKGIETARSVSEAFQFAQKSAEQGNAQAAFLLSQMYAGGELSVENNPNELYKWLVKSAELGYHEAQRLVGIFCYNGSEQLNIKQDYAKAAEWTRKSAEQDNVIAQLVLAGFYMEGIGVSQNRAEGEKWFRKAAAQGNQSAKQFLERIEQEKAEEAR
ncbi:MAG: SUMF1/EgtB/PvdO family nonheme iron enzyme [Planctomycetaceae bacterium]|jgi:formylglycine-generating enzyme required for sulfatase activity/TPR repeat protein|nr:SUMF1/EgtB/PvdO family nonheme iron enzyme [Planctomycetaceae bacterium]